METVTFPQKEVVEFIEKNVIPLRVAHDQKPLSDDFNVKWTPTLVVLDESGKEHHRNIGFLPPDELIAFMLVGIGRLFFDKGDFQKAIDILGKVIDGFEATGAAPEAIFVRAVAKFKATHEASHLKDAYETLQSNYPDSEWTKRALPYRLL